MAEDLFQTLMRFHREVVAPEFQQLLDAQKTELRNEMLTGFDAVYGALIASRPKWSCSAQGRVPL